MPVKQYRCVADTLTVRTQPQLGDQFKTNQTYKRNELLTINDDSRTEAGGFVWLKHDSGWSAERTTDGKTIFLLDASLKPKERMWGMNIDPYNPAANPPAAKLAGLGWVRFVFHISSQRHTIDQAFAYYDPIIAAHVKVGTKVLLVLIHDTYWGNGPWHNGGWEQYIPEYAKVAGQIAKRYKGQVAAYEVWNEGDLPPEQQSIPTSVYVPPQFYGPMLIAAAQAIKQADPAAKIVSGGLVSSDAIGYMQKVRDANKGVLPIDGIGIHPYGQTPPDAPVFPNWSQGSLGGYITRFADTFPGIPIWITEYGVPRVDVNNQSYWPPIANYMLKSFQFIRNNLFHIVPVVIWFGWADSQDNAGIVKDSQEPKGILFDTFFQNLRADQPVYVRTIDAPYNGKLMLAHIAGQFVSEASIGDLAKNVFTHAANVRGMIVKTSAGPLWEAGGDSKKAMAIGSIADVQKWTAELSKYRMDVHAWHDISGQNVAAETALISQVALAPGVGSVILDLDVTRLILRTSTEIRNFMAGLKKLLPATYHIGLSFEGRPEGFKAVNLAEWFPFISSWHPKIFHWQFSNTQQGPQPYIKAVFDVLSQYQKPIIPMLQAEATAGKPVPPDQIKQAARLALETYGAPAVSFWRTGALGPAEYAAIQSIYIPPTAGMSPAQPGADVLTVQINSPVRIRATPSLTGAVNGTLKPGEQITVLERSVIGSILWVRHSRGWTAARNAQTAEVFLA